MTKNFAIGVLMVVLILLVTVGVADAACVWGFEPGCDDNWGGWWARFVELVFG